MARSGCSGGHLWRQNLLLIQRGNEPQKYGWGFPGGSVNPGESLTDAACRELLEETGITAAPEQLFEIIEVNEIDPSGRHHHYVLIAVLCRYLSGTAMAADDALACQWVTISTILEQPTQYIEHVPLIAQKLLQKHTAASEQAL